MCDQQQSEPRDIPLRFRHRLSRARMQDLGLPAPKNRNREIARASLLGEVGLADLEGRKVAFSRRTQYYSSYRRYLGLGDTYANVIPEVKLLTEAG